MTDRYYACSASDNPDYWDVWFVADRNKGGLNVTNEIFVMLDIPVIPGAVFTRRFHAIEIAELANKYMDSPYNIWRVVK